jgi:hypothetical protein
MTTFVSMSGLSVFCCLETRRTLPASRAAPCLGAGRIVYYAMYTRP